jgi:hypothetical protein
LGALGVFLPAGAQEPRRVLHVMSYHEDWQWNKDQLFHF